LDELCKLTRSRPEPVLQNNTEAKTCAVHRFHTLAGALGGHLDRLLQEHMLAGCGAAPDEVEMGRRGREEDDNVDGRIAEDCFKVVRDEQIGIGLREGGTALPTWRVSGCGLDRRSSGPGAVVGWLPQTFARYLDMGRRHSWGPPLMDRIRHLRPATPASTRGAWRRQSRTRTSDFYH
jgi:hypothetical protein